jgi:predicted transcriptional regulator
MHKIARNLNKNEEGWRNKMTEIRVLAVRQPWASLIVEGLKTIEVRSRPTNIRERVAIYASRAKQEPLEGKYGRDYNYRSLPTGKIIGTVEIVGCVHLRNQFEFELYADEHLAPIKHYVPGNTYFWDLKNSVKFDTPVSYLPPKGAVIWSKTVLPEGY